MGMLRNIINGVRQRLSLDSADGWGTVLRGANPRALPGVGRPAETVLAVQSALKARCRAVSKVPLRLGDANDNVIESGDLYTLLERPNQWMGRNAYIEAIEAYLSLYDECLVAKVGEPGKNPDELIPLDPKKIIAIPGIHRPTGMQVVAGWYYSDAGGGIALDWDNVIPIIGTNPHAPFKGLSSLMAAERSIAHDVATREQNLALFSNGCMPDIILSTEKNIDPAQRKEILDAWNARQRGFTNAHKTGILWGGLKADRMAFNPSEMQALESLRLNRQDILMAMRVMPAMVMSMEGETGLSQGSSTAEQMVAWWTNEGLGELDRIASAHQQYLVNAYAWQRGGIGRQALGAGQRAMAHAERAAFRRAMKRAMPKAGASVFLWFDEGDIEELVEHRRKRIEQLGKLLDRGYLPDDINDYLDLGLPPHPTNRGTLPFSLQAVEDIGAWSAELVAGSVEQGAVSEERGAAIFDRIDGLLARALEPKRANAEDFKKVWALWAGFRTQWEKAAAKKYSKAYLEQRGRVLGRVEQLTDDALLNGNPDDTLNLVFPLTEENLAVSAVIKPLILNMFEAAHVLANTELGVQGAFEVSDPAIQTAVDGRVIQGAKINGKTTEDLRKILSQSFDEGWTQQELGDAIADYYGQQVGEGKARPQTAARTQVAGIVNDSRMIGARKAGGLRKGWLHGASEEPRPDHLAAEQLYMANPIGLDEKFIVGGEAMDAPGDASASVGQVANCTCMVVFLK